MSLTYSQLESTRFNLRILRGTFTKLEPYELLQTIVDERADVAILRIPSSEQHTLSQLHMLPWPTIVADTLVRFDCDLRSSPPEPMRNPKLEVRRGTPADAETLSELIDLSFTDYRTHYNSNPLFGPQKVLAGYKEWAMSCLEPSDERVCFLFYVGELAVAFSTLMLYPTYVEGVIYGARPNAPARGIYIDLVRHTKLFTHERGGRYLHGVTQVHNMGVQRVWVREGFLPQQAFCTVHINAMLHQQSSAINPSVATGHN
jgi:hypothetical protein